MKLSTVLLAAFEATSASTVCDLSDSGIFRQLPNGKYNFGSDYKLKFGNRNPATGDTLSNKGKLAKAKAQIQHRQQDAEFSDAWVTCSSNKMSSYYVRCNADGSYTINGKSGADIELPDCTPIGCDPVDLGPFNLRPYDNNDGCRKGYVDVNGKSLENNKNICYRYCGDDEERSRRKLKCTCDYKEKTCEYQAKVPGKGWIAWDAEGSDVVVPASCEAGTTPEPTPEPEPEPEPNDDWSDYGEWKACSASCGKGDKRKFRTCENEAGCTNDAGDTFQHGEIDSAREDCDGPDGPCPLGCKFPIGEFQQTQTERGCSADLLLTGDGFYVDGQWPQRTKCQGINCDTRAIDNMVFEDWTCKCSKPGTRCWWTISEGRESRDEELDFLDPVAQCSGLQGGRYRPSFNPNKHWTWVDGRRSVSKLASEVTDWELHDICYDPTAQWSALFAGRSQTDLNLIPGAKTYGRVVELADGRLVCRFRKGGDYSSSEGIIEDREIYAQLATRPGAMSWMTSERFFIYQRDHTGTRQHQGEYWPNQMVFPGNNGPEQSCSRCPYWEDQGIVVNTQSRYSEWWPETVDERHSLRKGKLPTHPALCRVEKDGQWFIGAVSYAEEYYEFGPYPFDGSSHEAARKIVCVAYDNEGNVVSGTNHNHRTRPESENDDTKSEYFVIGNDDGSSWTNWSDWTDCSATCGENARRFQHRQCVDSEGNEINDKWSHNCIPDWVKIEGTENYRGVSDWAIVGTTRSKDCEFGEYSNKEECPSWTRWSSWSQCTEYCGPDGTKTRSRVCHCNFETEEGVQPWSGDAIPCADLPDDNKWKTENMCGDAPATETAGCKQDVVCSEADGVGPGCHSDSFSWNTNSQRCYQAHCKSNDWCQHQGPSSYETAQGLIPHGYACYADTTNMAFANTCPHGFGFPTQTLKRDNPSKCECHQGTCTWGQGTGPLAGSPVRQDCTVGYEWIRLPSKKGDPYYNDLVDFNDPSQTGDDASQVIKVEHYWDSGAGGCNLGNWRIGRRLPRKDPMGRNADNIFPNEAGSDNFHVHRDTYALSAQCTGSGTIKWIDGPYECDSDCLRKYIQVDRTSHLRDWTLCGLNRFGFKTSTWLELDRLGVCRIGNEIGTLIRYRTDDTDGSRPVKCCRMGTEEGCQWNDGFNYDTLPFQMLYAGDCQA